MIDFYDLTIFAAVLAVVELIGILLAVDAVMRPRSSQAAIAWSIALIALPFITIPLYVIFGRTRFRGYQTALQEKEALVGEQLADWFVRMSATAAEPQEGLEAVEDLVKGLTQIPFTRGNHVALLVDGEATYGAMLDAIAGAESYVLVQFYIVMDGTVAQRMHDALIEKAQAGVRVYFLYDEIGCWSLPAAYLASLRNASIEVSGFKTTRGRRNRFQINFRNHRKLLVVDGRIGFIGGLNLADDYLKYRDTHLKVDDRFANRVEAMLKADLEHCESVDRAHFDDKPLRFRIAARIARLASPLL